MSPRIIRNALFVLELLVGIMALYGSVSLLVDAAGFGVRDAWLRGSPFTNYQIPALGLLIGVGGSSFLAAWALLRARHDMGALLSIGAGVVLVAFELAEAYCLGLRNFQQPLLFAVGLLIGGLGVMVLNERTLRALRRVPRVPAR